MREEMCGYGTDVRGIEGEWGEDALAARVDYFRCLDIFGTGVKSF